MSNPVLVRGFPDSWWFLLVRIVSFSCLSVGTYRAVNQQPGGQALLIVGGVILMGVETVAAYGRRRQLWAEDLGHGFRLTDRRGSREIRDQQIRAASLETREHFNEGLAESVTQRLSLWIDSEPQPLVMTTRIPVATLHPLRELWTRLFEGLKERSQAAFASGEPIKGAGWRLGRDAFELDGNGTSERFRLEDFTAIYVIHQHLCLWTHGDRPTVRIPIHSPNAQILRLLLEPAVHERFKAAVPPGDGLGRILYERRTSAANLIGLAILAAATGGLGVFLYWSLGQSFLGGLALVFAGLLGLSFVQHSTSVFRWHHFGVSQQGLLGVRQLSFTEVHRFQHGVWKYFYRGSYSHLEYRFGFHPHAGSTALPIIFNASVRNASDDGLNLLAEHLNQQLAHQAGEIPKS